jgi:exo-1,4-beta-D-glucosaminidase
MAKGEVRSGSRPWKPGPFFGLVSDVNMQSGDIRSHVSKHNVGSVNRTCPRLVKLIVPLFLSIGAGYVSSSSAAEFPRTIELAENWKLTSANNLQLSGAAISLLDYQDTGWHTIRRMPATVLEILEEDGVYPNLYVGKNMAENVPQDLYTQDWWYRTTFEAPAEHAVYVLEFPGINYRAEIWLNGHLIADSKRVVGMYSAHELNATHWIEPGQRNTLAVKVTPERAIQDVNGVELADSWFDWLNWKYLGYRGPRGKNSHGISFVPDRNAGIWKPVYLKVSGELTLSHPFVNTELSLLQTTSAKLTVYASLGNPSSRQVKGILRGTISRPGKTTIQFEQTIALGPGEERQASFTPQQFPQLVVSDPDLWWPYSIGNPSLYDLGLEFLEKNKLSDAAHIRFGIRSITQYRDHDEQFSDVGKGGNFYLKINGKDFLVRGAVYTPDLLYRYDPDREAAVLRYAKDLGLNMLRWESKISSEHIIELADEQGMPLMFGWMCCNQWEMWDQWDEEDHRVAEESLRSQIAMLRQHASVWIWANGSDGLPPDPVLNAYHNILTNLHWQNAAVDTVSSFAKDERGERKWNGIHMEGPYSWRPPTYWFSGRYAASRGSCAEQGDNEHIPTYESLKKFIPVDKLWPINETWYFHSGANTGNDTLINIQKAIDRRYGSSGGAEEFARKAQLAHFENTRAQFEAFAANGWANHKMTIYWMLNSHWPSFFGNIFDYYLSPGGAYYGAKTGLRPLSVVFDSYATGDHRQAKITVVNQTPMERRNLRVRVRVYDLQGKLREDRHAENLQVDPGGAVQAMTLPRFPDSSQVFFVRCQLLDADGRVLTENVYWQSQKDDDVGDPKNDSAFGLKLVSWADMTPLNTMPQVLLELSAKHSSSSVENIVTIRLHNPSEHIAFFERAEITSAKDGDELLPLEYDDNYVTVFPGETVEIRGTLPQSAKAAWVRLDGYDTPRTAAAIE